MKNLGRLSETEMEVMQSIWELATPVTVAQLLNIFEESKGWKTSTLSTILSRLIDKGFLTKTMKGKVNFYDVTLAQNEYQAYETQNLLHSLHGGNIKNFMTALVDNSNITQKDIEELKEWFQSKVGETE
ncbi:MAG: BlaI/MecI/CopY family transcriptional regulator [Oscillospiraceae bacterium]|nr:BlaI/MecI/CopY family transcriptional regulator [Oscillospiraceae bacterium]